MNRVVGDYITHSVFCETAASPWKSRLPFYVSLFRSEIANILLFCVSIRPFLSQQRHFSRCNTLRHFDTGFFTTGPLCKLSRLPKRLLSNALQNVRRWISS